MFATNDDLSPNGYEEDISTHLLAFQCAICGRPLRDPTSIERGWGPECDDKWMGGAGTERVWAQMHHRFDADEAAAVLRDAPNIEPTRWVEPVEVARKGQKLADGTDAKGGEVIRSRPLKVAGLKDYWISRGGSPDDPKAKWRHDAETRRLMVSNGIWYASRAVTFGYDEDVVGANKADPKWLVVSAVQRFARAVGLDAAADRMTQFYAAKVVKVVKSARKQMAQAEQSAIVFEIVDPKHRVRTGHAGPGAMRVHAPYNTQFNDAARAHGRMFFAFEKDPPYFWRYFRSDSLRDVVNIIQQCFGDQPSITRKQRTAEERERIHRIRSRLVPVLDVETQQVRYFEPAIAHKLQNATMITLSTGKQQPGRYQILKE